MNVLDRAIRHQQSIFVIEILPIAGCAVHRSLHESTVFWMNTLKDRVDSGGARLVIAKNSEAFLRPGDFAAGDVPAEAASLA